MMRGAVEVYLRDPRPARRRRFVLPLPEQMQLLGSYRATFEHYRFLVHADVLFEHKTSCDDAIMRRMKQ